jgi:hypothetical protein
MTYLSLENPIDLGDPAWQPRSQLGIKWFDWHK